MNYAPGVPATLGKDGGRVASPTGAADEGLGRTMVMAAPTPENLERLARLLADGTLRVRIQATYELAQAPDALSALATTHTRASSRSASDDRNSISGGCFAGKAVSAPAATC